MQGNCDLLRPFSHIKHSHRIEFAGDDKRSAAIRLHWQVPHYNTCATTARSSSVKWPRYTCAGKSEARYSNPQPWGAIFLSVRMTFRRHRRGSHEGHTHSTAAPLREGVPCVMQCIHISRGRGLILAHVHCRIRVGPIATAFTTS